MIGRNEDVPAHDPARLLADATPDPGTVPAHAAHLVHDLHEIRHEERAVLDAHDLEVREAAEEVVEHQRGDRVHDGPVAVEAGPLERGLAVRGRVGVLAEPGTHHLVVARLGDVKRHADPGLVQARPKGIEVGVCRRAAIARPGPQGNDASTSLEHRVEFGNGLVEIDQGEEGSRIDAPLVVEPPGLVEPAVEGAEVRIRLLGVVAHELFDANRQRGKQEAGFEALLVHPGQARLALDERGLVDLHDVSRVTRCVHLSQHLAQGARLGVVVEVEITQECEGLVAHHHALAALSVHHHPDRLVTMSALDVTRKAVSRLVIVIVGVEQPVIDLTHRQNSTPLR